MSVWYAVLLGLIQGAAEFLPVSSSAHLCLLQNLFPEQTGQDPVLFDVLLHLATLAAVCTVYRREMCSLFRELRRILLRPAGGRRTPDPAARKLLALLFLGTLPLLLTLPFREQAERLCCSTPFIGLALLCTGSLLYLGDRLPPGEKREREAAPADALAVGFVQALAVLPGLSRSGSTVVAGLARGFRRSFAVQYSFLLSLPAILGAALLKTAEAVKLGVDLRFLPACLLGMLAALISGFFSIRIVRILSDRGRFGRFRWYCWGLGLLVLLSGIFLKG